MARTGLRSGSFTDAMVVSPLQDYTTVTPVHLQPESWFAWHSPQYRKALRASFPPDRWPATEVTDPDGSLRFVLKDETEIHRIGILAEVYDYQTGKLVGHLGPRRRFVLLGADPAVEAAPSKAGEVGFWTTDGSTSLTFHMALLINMPFSLGQRSSGKRLTNVIVRQLLLLREQE